jgi:type I restriction enzyme S subunit
MVDPEFLSLTLSADESVVWLKQHAVGAVMPNLNDSIIRSFAFRLPPFPVQRAIAATVGAFDEKIELNRRMNETLESMVRAMFKSWFVDFDPVRAKVEGRQPAGMNAETASLFPSGFASTAIGSLPITWNLSSVQELTSLLNRGITPAYVEEGVLVLNQKCIRDHRVNVDLGRRHDPAGRNVAARQLEIGDNGLST